ncbi:MAG: T9SS type A sorting domain-containing protein [Bacteroidota bacterium]|nr:T9SS type A sorting domain-containing protein [Bacteroidota bacterium]
MKTKFFFAIVSVLFLWHTIIAQSPALKLAKRTESGDGASNSPGKSHNIFKDASGNVYTIRHDAGTKDIVIQKSGAAGNFIWAKSVTLDKAMNGNFTAIRSDAAGNVYTKRALARTADFEAPGLTPTPYSLGNVFILKLNASGNFIWANSVSSTGKDIRNSIDVDGSGNIYCTGNFSSTDDEVAGSTSVIAGKEGLIATKKTSFGIYPNPTSGNFVINMKLNEDLNRDAIVQVYNAQGKLVITNNIPMAHGVLFKNMNLSKSLAAGMYSVRITVDDKIRQQRLLIYQR